MNTFLLPNYADFYWIIAGSGAQIYSSRLNTFVSSENADYLAFLDAGNVPTRITNEAELWSVLAPLLTLPPWLFDGEHFVQPTADTFSKAQLNAYANLRQWQAATGGHIVVIDGEPTAFSTSEASMSLLAGKTMRLQQPNPPATVKWQVGPTAFRDIPAAEFTAAATEVADFVQGTFDTLEELFGLIADGVVTTPAGIDAAYS